MDVLIIHRKESFLRTVKEKFVMGGWQATTVANGLDGLLTARNQPFDLVICGYELPVISGTEVIRALRNLSVNKTTPAFLLTDQAPYPWQEEIGTRLEARAVCGSDFESSDIGKFGWLI